MKKRFLEDDNGVVVKDLGVTKGCKLNPSREYKSGGYGNWRVTNVWYFHCAWLVHFESVSNRLMIHNLMNTVFPIFFPISCTLNSSINVWFGVIRQSHSLSFYGIM